MGRSIETRLKKIEKELNPCVKGRHYVDIWILPEEQWDELAEWALGDTDKRPDFWPSEKRAIELRQHGYTIKTRDELREIIERCLMLNQKANEAEDGIDWESIQS
jgi:hypothetical protein